MKALRVGFTALVMGLLLTGCATSSSNSAKSGDDVSNSGCPDEDPFCDDDGGGDDGDFSEDGSSSGSGDGGGIFGGQDQTKTDFSSFDTVLAVKKGKDDKVGRIQLHPEGLKFGMSSEQIANLFARKFDDAFVERYKNTPVGPQTKALDYELKELKAQLRRSRLEFGNLPTGLDNGPLKGEYSYNNNESMTKLDLGNGIVRHFFFFNDRVWKVYDEVSLDTGKEIGSSFESAVAFAQEKIGVEPKKLEPDYDIGRNYEIAEWRDGSTILRLYNREYQKVVGVVFVDVSVESKLPTLRRNKPRDPTAVDPSVRDVTRPDKKEPGK